MKIIPQYILGLPDAGAGDASVVWGLTAGIVLFGFLRETFFVAAAYGGASGHLLGFLQREFLFFQRVDLVHFLHFYTQPFCERHRRGYETVRYRDSQKFAILQV